MRAVTHVALAAAAGMAVASGGCQGETTQIVVVVDSDMRVPVELEEIAIEVRTDDARVSSSSLSFLDPGAPRLPVTLGLTPAGRDPAPVTVIAVGRRGGVECVRQEARTHYVPGESRMLSLALLRRCAFVRCPDGETCGEIGCTGREVAAESLPPWSGRPAPIGESCTMSVVERCNHLDDDCDGGVDEGFDFLADPEHCGGCDRCPAPAGGRSECRDGSCALVCATGRGDCDGDPTNGCETDLSVPERCGGCSVGCTPGQVCALSGETFACAGECPRDTTRCGDSCIDPARDPTHCGGCDRPCGERELCSLGRCDCEPFFANCDGLPGCETPVADPMSCGDCGITCDLPHTAAATCVGGGCEVQSCDFGWEDCDGVADNGCETELGTASDCSRCNDVCFPMPYCRSEFIGPGHCEDSCPPLTSGYRVCGDRCVTLFDPRHCGGCDQPCPDGMVCIGVTCRFGGK